MPPLERPETLTAAVVAYVRDAVVRGEFEPDQPLPEVRLAQELRTSRVTVRVALRSLEELGLVEIIPHRGAFVTSLTARDAREIFSLRAELESYAARLALLRGPLSADTLARLEETLGAIDAAVRSDDVMNTIEAVMEFHRLIAEEAGHGLLLNHLANLRTQTRRLILYTKLHESDPLPEVTSHAELLDALRGGDPAEAERVMREHIGASGERLVQRMQELEAAPDNPADNPGRRVPAGAAR